MMGMCHFSLQACEDGAGPAYKHESSWETRTLASKLRGLYLCLYLFLYLCLYLCLYLFASSLRDFLCIVTTLIIVLKAIGRFCVLYL